MRIEGRIKGKYSKVSSRVDPATDWIKNWNIWIKTRKDSTGKGVNGYQSCNLFTKVSDRITAWSRKMGAHGHETTSIHVLEVTVEYNATRALFQQLRWDKFFQKFQGSNDEVALAFAIGL